MKIADTMVSMDATRSYTEVDNTNRIMQQGFPDPNSQQSTRTNFSEHPFQQNLFSLIHSSSSSQQNSSFSVTSGEDIGAADTTEDSSDSLEQQEAGFTSLVEHVAGTSITMHQMRGRNLNPSETSPQPVGLANLTGSSIHYEQESIFFQASGQVQTEDGRAISFNLGLQMQRQELMFQASGASIYGIDPLVLNFDDTVSIFDENYFSFDLDGDGEEEELSGLGSCCGFLALDRNGDGTINDGLELFGPSSGSGFGELAELDDDGNAWIDENDPIFDDLMVWMGVGGEEEQLISLREAGVGAISVGNLGTQFNLENADGEVQAVVQASGLFLMESGEPKSLLEVDMVPQGTEGDEAVAAVSPSGFFEMSSQFSFITSSSSRNQEAIEDLREMIFWQRLKMKMQFGEDLLSQSRNEMVERLEHLSSNLTLSFNS